MRGFYENYVSTKRVPKPATPRACILRHGSTSWCTRFIVSTEYAFEDAKRSVEIYAESKVLRACPECVAVYRETEKASEARVA